MKYYYCTVWQKGNRTVFNMPWVWESSITKSSGLHHWVVEFRHKPDGGERNGLFTFVATSESLAGGKESTQVSCMPLNTPVPSPSVKPQSAMTSEWTPVRFSDPHPALKGLGGASRLDLASQEGWCRATLCWSCRRWQQSWVTLVKLPPNTQRAEITVAGLGGKLQDQTVFSLSWRQTSPSTLPSSGTVLTADPKGRYWIFPVSQWCFVHLERNH